MGVTDLDDPSISSWRGKVMLSEPRGLGGIVRAGYSLALLSILVIAAVVGTAAFMIWHSRQSALEDHLSAMDSMGVVLVDQTSLYLQLVDLMLEEVQSKVASLQITNPTQFRTQLGVREFTSYLTERARRVSSVATIVVMDTDGQLINWSKTEPLERAADREYYRYLKEHNNPGLFIDVPSKSLATGKLDLYLGRRVSGPDGRLLGLVLLVVEISYLSDFYRAAGEKSNETVELVRNDGSMLIRYPNPDLATGVQIPQGSPWYKRVIEGGGSYVNTETSADAPSLVSVHPLRDYPLVVNILDTKAAVFSQWRKEAVYIAGFSLLSSLIFAGLLWILGRQFRQLSEAAMLLNEGKQILYSYAEMSVDWFWEQDSNCRFKSDSGIPFMTGTDNTGKTRRDLGDPAMAEDRWAAHEADLVARRPFRNFRWERVGSDGERYFIVTNGDPVFDRHGAFTGYRGTGRDITAEVEVAARLVQANAKLELGHEQFEAVLGNIMQGVCFFDAEKRLQVWNRRFAEIYDLQPNALFVGCSLGEILDLRHAARSTPDMTPAEYLARQELLIGAQQPVAYVLPLKNGRFINIFHHPMPGGGWVSTHEDVTVQHQAEASLMFMARHDVLTKLPNRVLFRERMEQAIAQAARGIPFAVVCLDLDNFKHVNDTLGHPVGDALLVAVADRLQACARKTDTVARLGGDEFAIIQLAVRQPEDAEVLVSQIIEAFVQPFDVDGHQIISCASIGVTVATGDVVSYEALMRDTDIALYLAKTERRGTARFFEPELDSRIHLRRMLELDLQSAIARNEFELHYQPQVNLISNKVSGFEALLRWNHPVRGPVSPLDFISVAEETGLIVGIGEWVLQTACLEAENWPVDVSVAVNLSPVQFRKGDLVATVRRALGASGLRPNRLVLEITESVFLGATVDTLKAIHDLRETGISVALDDFGTGYSSLSYLRNFAVNKIKIDQSFIRDLITSKESMSIVRAVTGLGQSLGMMTIAEGVETLEQLRQLREVGCTEVQGYIFGRPRPASEVPVTLADLLDRERVNQFIGADRSEGRLHRDTSLGAK